VDYPSNTCYSITLPCYLCPTTLSSALPYPALPLQIDPMARFSGDWEKEFKPMWDNAAAKAGNKAGNKAENSLKRQRDQMQGVYSQSGMTKGKVRASNDQLCRF
jgi:hypothetical protein